MAQSCHSALNRSIESCILGLMQQTMSKGMNANADNVRAKQKKLQQQNVAAVLLIGRGITDSGAAAYLPARKRSKQLYANAALRWVGQNAPPPAVCLGFKWALCGSGAAALRPAWRHAGREARQRW